MEAHQSLDTRFIGMMQQVAYFQTLLVKQHGKNLPSPKLVLQLTSTTLFQSLRLT